MKIHTSESATLSVAHRSLYTAKQAGQVAQCVYFDQFEPVGSRSHPHAAMVHLAASEKIAGDKRRHANTGLAGADRDTWAATYDEWGWFLSHLFAADPTAIAGPYKSATHFHDVTKGAYTLATALVK